MTAEIAIVNRSAITFAADSAMTLSVRGARKIYTGTDKIFELSEKDPIGLMIFNNLEFMGVPLDVAIKQFRSSSFCCQFTELVSAADVFFEYLTTQWGASDDLQRRHARQLLLPVFRQVRRSMDRRASQIFASGRRVNAASMRQVFLEAIQYEVKQHESMIIAECFQKTADLQDITETDISIFYKDTLEDIINKFFDYFPLEDDAKILLVRLGALALHKDKFSDFMSGLVFAGFGKSETFPSLIAYHIDGIVCGRLKKKTIISERTSRETISAKIIPFAQRDIVDRFLVGIDPDLEAGILEYLVTAKDKTENDIFDGLPRLGAKTKDKIRANLAKTLGVAICDFNSIWLKTAKDKYQQQTDDMVLFMAKQEMAHLAESLVNITSLKRKYSAEEETVAGPIDVAVISKNDGFVWVKRKHYFPPDLNPRYFARKFGVPTTTRGVPDAAP